jgi:hypothetical protein
LQFIGFICGDCGLLTDDQPLDDTPHVHSVGVGGDVDETLFAELVLEVDQIVEGHERREQRQRPEHDDLDDAGLSHGAKEPSEKSADRLCCPTGFPIVRCQILAKRVG